MKLSRRSVVAQLAALSGGLIRPASTCAAPAPAGSGCRSVTFESADYAVCAFDLRRYDVKLFLLGPDGRPYANLSRLVDSPAGAGLAMAMNAGMYHPDLMPVGLYVEGSREMTKVSRANGPGNFHLKPNGVFFVGDGRAGVLETDAFIKARPRVEYATQSGPMLVIDDALHPKFSQEGESRKVRNGVGTPDGRSVVFAISQGPVSFGAFARLFRDGLGCRNALFLDGSISSLYAPELGRRDVSLKPLGPLVGIVPRSGR